MKAKRKGREWKSWGGEINDIGWRKGRKDEKRDKGIKEQEGERRHAPLSHLHFFPFAILSTSSPPSPLLFSISLPNLPAFSNLPPLLLTLLPLSTLLPPLPISSVLLLNPLLTLYRLTQFNLTSLQITFHTFLTPPLSLSLHLLTLAPHSLFFVSLFLYILYLVLLSFIILFYASFRQILFSLHIPSLQSLSASLDIPSLFLHISCRVTSPDIT